VGLPLVTAEGWEASAGEGTLVSDRREGAGEKTKRKKKFE